MRGWAPLGEAGSNGSGESYTAMLLYALYRALHTHLFDITSSLEELADEARSSGSIDRDYYRKACERAKNYLERSIKENMVALFIDLDSLVNVNSDRLIASLRFGNRITRGFTLVKGKSLAVNYMGFENLLSIIKEAVDSIVSLSLSRSPNEGETRGSMLAKIPTEINEKAIREISEVIVMFQSLWSVWSALPKRSLLRWRSVTCLPHDPGYCRPIDR